MSNIEQTLSIIKPDAVERNLEGEIKEIFKNKGFQIILSINNIIAPPTHITNKSFLLTASISPNNKPIMSKRM